MTPTPHPPRGFLLSEIIVVLVLSGIVIGALLAGLVALVRGMQPQTVTLHGETLAIAPTFGAFTSAVRLHQAFTDRASAARAIYVFGGRHLSIPPGSPAALVQPLRISALPAIDTPALDLPMSAASFYERYHDSLGEQDAACSPDDFSIVVVGPAAAGLAVTCLVQSRRTDAAVTDGAETRTYAVRDVRLWDLDQGMFRYAFAEPIVRAPGAFTGAVHTWYRHDLAGTAEEGPGCVIFPDPWLYAGARGRSADVPPFSRFSYFLPVSR
ncbi:MAG TPA: hypothetical protein VHE61_04350 [Opitutaceae bacterium]|nr:hypothetical protein [Opitutaceae bacterium]